MLNVISAGFIIPQEGEVWFHVVPRRPATMRPYKVAQQGIARTFQNIALFKGMSTLDNIMTGRMTKMKSGRCWAQAIWWGKAAKEEEFEHREKVERDH